MKLLFFTLGITLGIYFALWRLEPIVERCLTGG